MGSTANPLLSLLKGDALKKGESGGVRSREMKRNYLIVKTIYEKCRK